MNGTTAKTHWKHWLKKSHHPVARLVRVMHYWVINIQFPLIPIFHRGIYVLHCLVSQGWEMLAQFVYWTPLFKSRIQTVPRRLQLYSGMPQVLGALDIHIGEGARISGQSSFFGRTATLPKPQLIIGENVDIGWQTTIAVGTRVILEDNVRMAGRVFLAGFPGHPVDPEARARGEADNDDQVGDIILERNVWVASGVTVLAGVRIGRNTIVGAGSVVTHDLPANVIAAGVPAKVVKRLSPDCEV
ncbi:MAG: acyltransferase [Hahellaceae bacterium]|nr:acyltransferase [Hahellaceae bacterium]MCP5210253.1 acyltransferase [Hahellaceae bacterium]